MTAQVDLHPTHQKEKSSDISIVHSFQMATSSVRQVQVYARQRSRHARVPLRQPLLDPGHCAQLPAAAGALHQPAQDAAGRTLRPRGSAVPLRAAHVDAVPGEHAGAYARRKEEPLARDGLCPKLTCDDSSPSSRPIRGDFFSSLVFATVAHSAPSLWQRFELLECRRQKWLEGFWRRYPVALGLR